MSRSIEPRCERRGFNEKEGVATIVATVSCVRTIFATQPNEATRRWWSHVRVLASDSMQGRDTGSAGYRKAADYVTAQFARAGLQPAGESGFSQSVPLHAVRFRADQSTLSLVRANGRTTSLRWLRQMTVPPRTGMPSTIDAPLAFAGWQINDAFDVRGKVLVTLAPPRFIPNRRGYVQAPPPGYLGSIVIESPAGPEPARWPAFSSLAMTLSSVPLPAQAAGGAIFLQFNPADADELFRGSGHAYRELQALADAGEHLPSFALPASLRGRMVFDTIALRSDNLIAVRRGADPVLADEYVVVSAHLDGYGVGEAVNRDRIYNGTLDDAAYVATLIELADRLGTMGQGLRRSVLFCVFTAEERGLLGSQYFAAHPTVPKERMVANINLDMLRPVFPLTSLTTMALDESTLGDHVRRVGESMRLRIKPDSEPDRGLLQRSDHWSFLQAGVPAVGFTFGYEPGSIEEAAYRRWYAERSHSPADDVNQPWDPAAAERFK